MNELPWVSEARKYIGLSEVQGPKHNPTILGWLRQLKAWWSEDETPWCGTFVAAILKTSNRYVVKDWFRARAWVDGGVRLTDPAYGCIVVFSRTGGGHVGFVVGQDEKGSLMVLGGNQSNRVSIAAFPKSRVLAYVWPAEADGTARTPAHSRYELPKYNGSQPLSENEA